MQRASRGRGCLEVVVAVGIAVNEGLVLDVLEARMQYYCAILGSNTSGYIQFYPAGRT